MQQLCKPPVLTPCALSAPHQAELSPPWLLAFEVATRPRLVDEFTPQGLSMMVWAMATLGYRPGVAWMDALVQVRTKAAYQPTSFPLLRSCKVSDAVRIL